MAKLVTTVFSPPTSRPGSAMNESDDDALMDPDSRPRPSHGDFLTIVPEALKKFSASSKSMGKLMCMTCNKETSFDPKSNKSSFGLKSHYERKHRGQSSALKSALEGSSKRSRSVFASSTHSDSLCNTKKLYQSSIKTSFEPKSSKQKTLMLYCELFIEKLLFLKGNMNLLKSRCELEDSDKGEYEE